MERSARDQGEISQRSVRDQPEISEHQPENSRDQWEISGGQWRSGRDQWEISQRSVRDQWRSARDQPEIRASERSTWKSERRQQRSERDSATQHSEWVRDWAIIWEKGEITLCRYLPYPHCTWCSSPISSDNGWQEPSLLKHPCRLCIVNLDDVYKLPTHWGHHGNPNGNIPILQTPSEEMQSLWRHGRCSVVALLSMGWPQHIPQSLHWILSQRKKHVPRIFCRLVSTPRVERHCWFPWVCQGRPHDLLHRDDLVATWRPHATEIISWPQFWRPRAVWCLRVVSPLG